MNDLLLLFKKTYFISNLWYRQAQLTKQTGKYYFNIKPFLVMRYVKCMHLLIHFNDFRSDFKEICKKKALWNQM